MRTHEDFKREFAQLLKRLRIKKGLSLRKASELIDVDYHTFAKYESGESAPTVPDFVYFCKNLGADALPLVLGYLYPTIYNDSVMRDTEQERTAVAHYFLEVARNQEISEMNYLINGNHGSSLSSQIAMYTMIDHLPMYYRVTVAQLIDTLWRIAESRGELVEVDGAMPDVELFRNAMNLGTNAVLSGKDFYSILPNKEGEHDAHNR